MRFLHWFNALSWVVLLATGVGLLQADAFALAGRALPAWLADAAGGAARLVRLHALWGVLWAALVVPLFLVFKHGPRGAWAEIRPTADDLRWLLAKPLALLGLRREPLPPQDKYNAGQKAFAALVLVATASLVATGAVMVLHLGPPALVQAAVGAHGITVAAVVLGLGVHLAMALVLREERPALVSMLTGRIDRHHAERHCAKWPALREDRCPPRGGEGEAP
jgi:formate dehydrogenase gamma subunit